MADPTPQRNAPAILGEVNDGDVAIFRVVVDGGVFITSGGSLTGATGPSGSAGATGATGATGPTGPTGP